MFAIFLIFARNIAMRILIQRVRKASVNIAEKTHANINSGMLILIGIEENDEMSDIDWLCGKISKLRIFDDAKGIMNLSINEVEGEILLISQFTLHASTRKGARPSYIKAASPDQAIPLYNTFISELDKLVNTKVQTGVFGAEMQVERINDGPVTLFIDSKNRE